MKGRAQRPSQSGSSLWDYLGSPGLPAVHLCRRRHSRQELAAVLQHTRRPRRWTPTSLLSTLLGQLSKSKWHHVQLQLRRSLLGGQGRQWGMLPCIPPPQGPSLDPNETVFTRTVRYYVFMCFAPSFLRSPGDAVTRISESKHCRGVARVRARAATGVPGHGRCGAVSCW